jgi:hypothetical protein
MSRETDLAWAAGITDGEGCFQVVEKETLRGTRHEICSHVKMSHQETIRKFRSIIGCGTIYTSRVNHEIYAQVWIWRCNGSDAVFATKSLFPYLVTKREQAKVILEFGEKCLCKRGKGNEVSDEIIVERKRLHVLMRQLNKRGPK